MDAPGVLRAARRSAGMSQLAFAEHAGVSPGTLAAWEAGTRTPSFAEVARALRSVGLEPTAIRSVPADPELVAHLHRSLSDRLRLALGETLVRRGTSRSQAWRSLLVLARCGTAVIEPPVAHALWVPVLEPYDVVHLTLHRPHTDPADAIGLPGLRCHVTDSPPPPSLVSVSMARPSRVWVLPPAELAVVGRLQAAAELLHRLAPLDDAGRRRPAHRDPDDSADADRALHAYGIRASDALEGADSRAWRLGVGASAAQQLRDSGAVTHR